MMAIGGDRLGLRLELETAPDITYQPSVQREWKAPAIAHLSIFRIVSFDGLKVHSTRYVFLVSVAADI